MDNQSFRPSNPRTSQRHTHVQDTRAGRLPGDGVATPGRVRLRIRPAIILKPRRGSAAAAMQARRQSANCDLGQHGRGWPDLCFGRRSGVSTLLSPAAAVRLCWRDPADGASRLASLSRLPDYPELIAQGPLGYLVTRGILDRFAKQVPDRGARRQAALDWLARMRALPGPGREANLAHIHTCTSRPRRSPMTWQASFRSWRFLSSLSLVPTSQPGANGSVCVQSPGFSG